MNFKILISTLFFCWGCLALSFGQVNFIPSEKIDGKDFAMEDYSVKITEYNSESHGLGRFSSYVFKDSRGLIWMTSLMGLHRFDGRNIKTFNKDNYLPYNLVMEVHEDSEGYFWLYKSCFRKNEDNCFKSLIFFNPNTYDTLNWETRFGNTVPFFPRDIDHIQSNKKGDVFYIRTQEATYKWKGNEGFEKLPPNELDSRPYVFTVLENGQVGCYLKKEDKFIYYLLNDSGKMVFQQQISDKKRLPEYFNVYPYTFAPATSCISFRNSIRYESPSEFFIHKVAEDGRLKTDNILSKVDLGIEFGARHLFFDESTNTFWNADRKGIQRIELRKKRFHNIPVGNNETMVRLIRTRSDGAILLGADVGTGENINLFFYNKRGKQNLKNIINDTQKPSKDIFSDTPELYVTPPGLIVSTQSIFRELNVENDLFEGTGIQKFHFVKVINQQIWLGTSAGLWVYDYRNNDLKKYEDNNQFSDFDEGYIKVMEPIDSDRYWVGTDMGLFLLSLKKGLLERYDKNQTGKYYLPLSRIYHFEIQKDSSLLLASESGLVHFKGKRAGNFENGKHFKFYSEKDGFPSSYCLGVYSDDFGFFWIATTKGLVQVEKSTGRLKVYSKKNGFNLDFFMAEGHHKAPDGELFFGSLGGFVHFHPSDFKDEDFGDPDIPLIIVEFEQYDQQTEKFKIRTQELLSNAHITLSPNAKIFNLRVALADYRGADKHQFAYRIPGYQEEWQIDKSNLIRISGLSSGDHVLEIKGRLEDGRFSSNVLKIPVTVLAPIYLRWWFLLSLGILLTGLGFFLAKQRTQQLKERQIELERLVKERTKTIEDQAEELRSLDEMKSRFFANVSHELRTPLTLMLAPIENSLKRNKLENRDYTNLLTAKQNGKHLGKMINEILDLTKLAAGKLELNPETRVWYNFIKVIVSNFESLANRNQIDFHFKYEGNKNLQVQIDPQKTEIILLNLLSNAFKFTSKGGTILFHSKDDGENLILKIEDSGRGIHPEDLPNVFDRFYQTKQKNATAEGGTGIGLALTQEFVQLMEGQIEVKSELEKGSIFKVTIPKIEVISQVSDEEILLMNLSANKEDDEGMNKERIISEGNASPKSVILLVEDNLDLQDFIKSLLESEYEVITADNGKEALSILSKQDAVGSGQNNRPLPTASCHLIISDIMMPLMDGYQLLEAVKSNEKLRHLPMIMLTARVEVEDKLKALKIGVDDYLTKPFVEEELLARIENLLKNAKFRQLAVAEHGQTNDEIEKGLELELPTEEEKAWLKRLDETILTHLSDFNYTLDDLAAELLLSKRQLHRRIKQLIGQTANDYIKTMRLAKARKLLETGEESSVKAVAYSVGFKDVAYFSKQFKKEFGKLPSKY